MERRFQRALGLSEIQVCGLTMNKKIIVRAIFIIWIFIWILFLIRPYFKNDLLKEYSTLLGLSLDGKRAYITGIQLYEFIKFCNSSIKPPSSYMIRGLEDRPLDHQRAIYYLYPNIEKETSQFLLVYNTKDAPKEGWVIFRILDSNKYILKRVRN